MQISSQSQASMSTSSAAAPRAVQAVPTRSERVGTAGPPPTDARPPRPANAETSPDPTASSLARLDSFMEAAMERLQNAVDNAPPGEVTSFREASASMESGFARLREGISNGTLAPEDIQRGVRNTFEGAREILDAARPVEGEEGMATAASGGEMDFGPASQVAGTAATPNTTGETVRARYGSFTDSVMERISGLEDMDSETASAVADAAAAFESAAARLDQALFNPESGDPIDRGTFQTLYSDALSSLQSQLTSLIGGANREGGAPGGILYTAQRGAEAMNRSGFGLDVAG